jgi:hypothetical protein
LKALLTEPDAITQVATSCSGMECLLNKWDIVIAISTASMGINQRQKSGMAPMLKRNHSVEFIRIARIFNGQLIPPQVKLPISKTP